MSVSMVCNLNYFNSGEVAFNISINISSEVSFQYGINSFPAERARHAIVDRALSLTRLMSVSIKLRHDGSNFARYSLVIALSASSKKLLNEDTA